MIKDTFTIHGVYCDSNFTAYEIEISEDGSRARIRYSIGTAYGIQYNRPRWQDIKFTRSGKPFVTYKHQRLNLDNFLRP